MLQKSHSDRREVENKLPANERSLEHCDVDVGTTFSRATVHAGAYATARAERGRQDEVRRTVARGDAPRPLVLSPPSCSANIFT